jgi:hypothetical protein
MGFDISTNPIQRTLGFTAPKHIAALRALVAGDCSFTPKSPSAADIGTLYACEAPIDKNSLEHLLFVNRVSFCQQGLGSLRHISKIRCDIAGTIGFQCRFSHDPRWIYRSTLSTRASTSWERLTTDLLSEVLR